MFSHLHVHSWFSLKEGVSSPEVLAKAAVERGFATLACTDTNGVYGAVEFQQTALSYGLRPILGAQLITGGQETLALAKDEKGWAALCRAITAIHWSGGQAGGRAGGPQQTTEPPERDRVPLGARSATRDEGVLQGRTAFALSSHLAEDRAGLILLSRDAALLEDVARKSGTRDLYAELRPGKERHAVGAAAKRMGIPAVVTGAVMFAHPEDWPTHRLRVAIAENAAISSMEGRSQDWGQGMPWPQHSWLRPTAELARHFPDCPDAVTRSMELAEQCQYRIPVGDRIVSPRFACPDDSFERLRAMAYAGAEARYGTIAPITRDRLEHELAIIGVKKFADYFLVVHDIVQHGPTHCGRGSVANSIVSYALGITHVDPLGSGLLFERFLNPERKDPPDIDLDFPWDERDEILGWVFEKYPHPRAAMVANHNCFRLRGALREVAKVHGRPPGEIREITRRFPWFMEGESIGDVLAGHPNFSQLDLPKVWQDLARMAQPLVGVPRHLSLHPGGVVIVPESLTDFVPVEPAAKVLDGRPHLTVPVIQFEKDGAEDAGLVKIDLLGNRSLAVIRDAIREVRVNTGTQIDYTSSDPAEDEPTRALFRTGQTMGVFYTESPASRLLCAKSRADTFELLVLNTSIIRPASNAFIRIYLERLHGGHYQPLDPCLRDTLAETFGVMVYQEDVVNVCATFAGMPLSSGDGLRKALSKKRPVKQLAAYAEEFFAGAKRLGREMETATRVWEMVMSFAGYSFCKGHSCSYIQVAQHSCYLRANYPAEFMAGVLANGGGFYHPFAYVAEAMRMGLTVRPPDVNASRFRSTGKGREVRIGLQFIKGLSDDAVERMGKTDRRTLSDPSATAPFTSFDDFRARTSLRHDDLRLLIQVGAFDSIASGMTRPMLLWMVDREAVNAERGTGNGERDTEFIIGNKTERTVPRLKEYSQDRRRRTEYELLGFTTDSHPMDLFQDELKRLRVVLSTELHRHVGQTVVCAGMLTTAKPVHTKKDEPMEFATFDDGAGLIEAVLFPDIYHKRGHVLFDQGPFLFRGKVEEEFGAVTVTMTGLERLERAVRRADGQAGRRAEIQRQDMARTPRTE